jgi:hypothetical protein
VDYGVDPLSTIHQPGRLPAAGAQFAHVGRREKVSGPNGTYLRRNHCRQIQLRNWPASEFSDSGGGNPADFQGSCSLKNTFNTDAASLLPHREPTSVRVLRCGFNESPSSARCSLGLESSSRRTFTTVALQMIFLYLAISDGYTISGMAAKSVRGTEFQDLTRAGSSCGNPAGIS